MTSCAEVIQSNIILSILLIGDPQLILHRNYPNMLSQEEQLNLFLANGAEWGAYQRSIDNSELSFAGADLRRSSRDHLQFDGVDLSEVNLNNSNLPESSFKGADLSNAKFELSRLFHTIFDDAILRGADYRRADMLHTSLRGADLGGANFRRADLRGTDFTGADLRDANFKYAVIRDVSFEGAKLENAIFNNSIVVNTNFTDASGLDGCVHNGPSTIDHRTLQLSGMLPHSFLRGFGLPDSLIDYYPSLLGNPISYYSCFISYSHADKLFARRLKVQLEGRGIRCWLDEHQLLAGDDTHEQIDRGIRLWDKVLLCCSERSLNSWWVDNEIETTFSKERDLMKARGKKVLSLIPLNLDGFMFGDKYSSGKAAQIKSRFAPDFTGWESSNDNFEKALDNVEKALMAGDGGREIPPVPKI